MDSIRMTDIQQAPEGNERPRRAPIDYTWMTAAELAAAEFELEFIIPNTLVAGQPLIIAGAKKVLKTSLVLDLAISLASGKPFLNALPVDRPCRAGIMTGESGMATVQETCKRICAAKGLRLENLLGLIVSENLPRLDSAAHLDQLAADILANELSMAIIDPAYLCLPMESSDASNLFKVGGLLRGLSDVCRDTGATLVLCHHTRKNIANPYAPAELEDVSWAGFQEWCRQWWLISRREKYEPGSGDHRLWLNVGGSAGHSALWGLDIQEGRSTDPARRWDVQLLRPTDARDEAESRSEQTKEEKRERRHRMAVEKCKELILAALLTEADTKDGIKNKTARKGQVLYDALAELLRVGELEECTVPRGNGQTYKGFRRTFVSR